MKRKWMLGMLNDINMSQDYAILINEKPAIFWEQIPNYSMELRKISTMGREVNIQVNSLPSRNVPW